jgi:uncharacterized protein with PIN domain
MATLNKHGIPILNRHPHTKPFDLAQMRPRALQCEGKMRHRNRENALVHQRAAGPEYKTYNCPHCHYWHVGHSEDTLVLSTTTRR